MNMRQLHRYQLICDTQYTPYYYCIDKSTFEQDFMIQMEDRIVPIEVKAEGNCLSKTNNFRCWSFFYVF